MRRENNTDKGRWPGIIRSIILLSLLLAACISFNVFAEESSDAITVRFLDAYAGSTGLNEMTISPKQTIKLPAVPADRKAPSGTIYGSPSWKPVTGKTDSYLRPSSSLTYAQAKTLCSAYGNGNTLNLYGTRVLYLTYYNNAGTQKYSQKFYYEGTGATLSGSPNQKNPAYKGWTTEKGGNAVTVAFGQKIQLQEDMNLYLAVYARVRYYGKNGSRLYYTGYYKRGTTITIASVPALNNYRPLGWNTKKNASQASVSAGSKEKITRDMDFYAKYIYLPYTVKFTDNSGKSTSSVYKKLGLKTAAGESITLPELPAVKNMIALGWSTTANDTAARAKAGEKVRITANTTYYAVYRAPQKKTVMFCDTNGSTPQAFTALKTTVTEGNRFTLPDIPEKEGYFPVCWRLNVNGTIRTYDAGTKIFVRGNYRFYAFYKQRVQIILHYNDGQVYKTEFSGKGLEYTLPSMENPSGYTFMGWGTKSGITLSQSRPRKTYYEPDTSVVVNGTSHFYAILMKRSEEPNLSKDQLQGSSSPDTSAYKRIIFVGDSRTTRLKLFLTKRGIDFSSKKVSFVQKGGSSIEWLESTGYKQILDIIAKDGTKDTRPTAIIFNSGINGLNDYGEYVSFYKKIAPELREKNCRLYIMSINPINSVMIEKMNFIRRQPSQLRTFNEYLRTNLSGLYTYIDTYTWLMQTGFSTDRGDSGYDTGVDDGLHYTLRTYQRIYFRCLQFLAGS